MLMMVSGRFALRMIFRPLKIANDGKDERTERNGTEKTAPTSPSSFASVRFRYWQQFFTRESSSAFSAS